MLTDGPDEAIAVLHIVRVVRVGVRVGVLVANGGGCVEAVIVQVGGGRGRVVSGGVGLGRRMG